MRRLPPGWAAACLLFLFATTGSDRAAIGPLTGELAVTPASFSLSLLSGQRTTTSMQIDNRGDLAVDFRIAVRDVLQLGAATSEAGLVPQWITVQPSTGSIRALESQNIQITIDAAGLAGGDHRADLAILGNDPLYPEAVVRVDLHVVGSPEINVTPTTLQFGQVHLGAGATRALTVLNSGTDRLVVSEVSSSDAVFSTFSGPFDLLPGASLSLQVAFAPSQVGPVTAELRIRSNDADEPLVIVPLQAEGVIPPSIGVSPAFIEENLYTGGTTERRLTLSNAGGAELAWEGSSFFEPANRPPVLPATAVLLIQDALPWGSNVVEQSLLNRSIPYHKIQSAALSSTDLSGYRTIVVPSDQPTSLYERLVAASARIEQFVSDGGMLEFHGANGYNSGDPTIVGLPGGVRARHTFASGQRVVVPTHPLVAGVPGTFSGSTHCWLSQLPPQATVVVTDGTLRPTLVTYRHGRGQVVTGCQTYEYDSGNPSATILRNMIPYVQSLRPAWVIVVPESGSVPGGGSIEITASFDARNLSGGDYGAGLSIRSNDPVTPIISVPVVMHVIPAPDISITPPSLAFGSLFLGDTGSLPLTVTNHGIDTLTVAEPISSSTEFIPPSGGFTLAPGKSRTLDIVFAPARIGVILEELHLSSDDPDEPLVVVPLQGEAVLPPEIGVSPPVLEQTLPVDATATQSLGITNSGFSSLSWQIEGAGSYDLESVLSTLNTKFAAVTALIPNRYDFFEGDVGNQIYDGGSDMYDGGNLLRTNLGSLAYSNNAIRQSAAFGPGGRYFTRKFPGLFVLAADMQGVSSFTIEGNLGADGGGSVDGSVLTLQQGGVTYRGFVKRVFSAFDPSVNHLVIVEDVPGVSHEFSASTNDDFHRVNGLSQTRRLYYLLYARASGGYIDDLLTRDIMLAFLTSTRTLPRWLDVTPTSGTLPAGGRIDLAVSFDAHGLLGGRYDTELLVSSNDPDDPEIYVPVEMRVVGIPDIGVAPPSLAFGPLFIGASTSLSLTVSNTGTDTLTAEPFSTGPDFISPPGGFSLAPGQSRTLDIVFAPTTAGTIREELHLTSNDPDEPVVVVPLQGDGLLPPEIGVSPPGLEQTLPVDTTAMQPLTITNTGFSALSWQIEGAGSGDLDLTLSALNARFPAITGLIPNRHDFSEGEGGTQIYDGGADMYDGGNFLRTNLGYFSYSNNVVVQNPVFGPGGRYFTRKFPGLFVLAADMQGVTSFNIEGNLGADGAGAVDGSVLTLQQGGVTYRGFVKRVFNAGVPSVNHLVIVEDVPVVSHEFSASTNDDFHRVNGLSQTRRLYYLLYARASGGYIDDLLTRDIMLAFLTSIRTLPRWLDVTPTSGTLAGGGRIDLSVSFDANGLLGGRYGTEIVVSSNDPDDSEIHVPVAMTAVGIPDIVVAPVSLAFGPLFLGDSTSLPLTVSNHGTDSLTVTDPIATSPEFIAPPGGFSLAPGQTRTLDIVFAPTKTGTIREQLHLSSNDPDEPVVVVPLQGDGVAPPRIDIAPAFVGAKLFSGGVAQYSLTITNTGGSDLSWEIGRGSAPPAAAGSVPAAGTPDLTHDSSVAPSGYFPAVSDPMIQGARVLLVKDAAPWESGAVEQILQGLGTAYDRITSISLASTDLSRYRIVIVPSDQPTSFYQRLAAAGGKIDQFVSRGGVLEYHAAGSGWNGGDSSLITLPGGMRSTQGLADVNHVVTPGHPLVTGVPSRFTGSSASHCHFWQVPAGASIVASDHAGRPNLVVYRHGLGQVITGCQTFEFGYDRGQAAGTILRNMIPFVLSAAPAWLAVEPASGIVPPGGTGMLLVKLTAARLVGGVYEDFIEIGSNDPIQPSSLVDVALEVTDAADIKANPAALDFGEVITGRTRTLTIEVSNEGSELLDVTSLKSDHPAFILDTAPFNLPVGATRVLELTFVSASPGLFTGNLRLASNDVDEETLVVPMRAVAALPPDVEATPGRLSETLFSGETLERAIRLANSGGASLHFSTAVEAIEANATLPTDVTGRSSPAVVREYDVDGLDPWQTNSRGLSVEPAPGAELIFGAAPPRVLLYSDDPARAPGFHYPDLALQSLGLAYTGVYGDPARFRSLLTGGSWELAIVDHNLYYGAGALWSELEAFVLGGGKLLLSTFDIDGSHSEPTTLWSTLGFTPSGSLSQAAPVFPWIPYHPIFNDPGSVPDLTTPYDEYLDDGDRVTSISALAVGGLTPAPQTGQAAILVSPHRDAVVNSFLVSEHRLDRDGDGRPDAVQLLRNEITFLLNQVGWLVVEPSTGDVPGGGAVDLTVRFDASVLLPGRHEARIRILSDDPDETEVAVPVVLDVLSGPRLVVSPEQLDFGTVTIGHERGLTLHVSNPGNEPLVVASLTASPPDFVPATGGLEVPPKGSAEVPITFHPSSLGRQTGFVTLIGNAPGSPHQVPLAGAAVTEPEISVVPAGISAVATGGVQARELRLCNDGGSPLEFEIEIAPPQTGWLFVEPGAGSVPPGECLLSEAKLDAWAAGPGEHTASLVVGSNDPDEPLSTVQVRLMVPIEATIEMDPPVLNPGAQGGWITAHVELPPPFSAGDIDVGSVTLNGSVPGLPARHPEDDHDGDGIPDLALDFERGAVLLLLPEQDDPTLVLTGRVGSSHHFLGSVRIGLFRPHVISPDGGELLTAGETHRIGWEVPDGWQVDEADLYQSLDDGRTWQAIALHVRGDHFLWTVPSVVSGEARVRVNLYGATGLLGRDASDRGFGISPGARPVRNPRRVEESPP